MDLHILYLVTSISSIFSGKVRCHDKQTSDVNLLLCSQGCLEDGHPCTCYTDGWIACNNRNLTTIPSLPICSRMIRLQHNQIESIEKYDFNKTVGVEIIDLSYNKITKLRSGVFEHLTALSALILHRNSIVTADACALYGLSHLTSLDLSFNQITTLPEGVFDGNPALQEISLYQNNITELNRRWFQNKTQLKAVVLYGNPWNCSCQLWASYQHIINQSNVRMNCEGDLAGILSSMCMQCNFPPELKRQTLQNLTRDNFTQCDNISVESYRVLEIRECGNSAHETTHEITRLQTSKSINSLFTTKYDKSMTTSTLFVPTSSIQDPQSQVVETWIIAMIFMLVVVLSGLLAVALKCRANNKRKKMMKMISHPRMSTDFIISYQQT